MAMADKDDEEDSSKNEKNKIVCVVKFEEDKGRLIGNKYLRKLPTFKGHEGTKGAKRPSGGESRLRQLLCPCCPKGTTTSTALNRKPRNKNPNLRRLVSQVETLEKKLNALEALYVVHRMETVVREKRLKNLKLENEQKQDKSVVKEDKKKKKKKGIIKKKQVEAGNENSNRPSEFVIDCRVVRKDKSTNDRSEAGSKDSSRASSKATSRASSKAASRTPSRTPSRSPSRTSSHGPSRPSSRPPSSSGTSSSCVVPEEPVAQSKKTKKKKFKNKSTTTAPPKGTK